MLTTMNGPETVSHRVEVEVGGKGDDVIRVAIMSVVTNIGKQIKSLEDSQLLGLTSSRKLTVHYQLVLTPAFLHLSLHFALCISCIAMK